MERFQTFNFTKIDTSAFERKALDVFRVQANENPVYAKYLELLGIIPSRINTLVDIPYLPISFFRTQKVVSGTFSPQVVFTSSGTTGSNASRHYVASLNIYKDSFLECFRLFYGEPSHYCILALLPSYLDREGSSLVYMVDSLIKLSNNARSGFFPYSSSSLIDTINSQEADGQPTLLIGVTFALLELARKFKKKLKNTLVMETGGMKGRGPELTRMELHSQLGEAYGVEAIHSEYGMTELLSQAYSKGNGLFLSPPWMSIAIRDPYDPLSLLPYGMSGGINVIDLANVHSCSFIQTDDLGVLHPNGYFEVLGRLDGSQVRGCNLLL